MLTTKEAILTALFTLMETIKKANGYSNTVKHVDRQYTEISKYLYPAIFVNDVREDVQQLLSDLVRKTYTVNVIAFVYDAEGTVSTSLNSFIADVAKALNTKKTLDGTVKHMKTLQIVTDEGILAPHGVSIFTLEILYFGVC